MTKAYSNIQLLFIFFGGLILLFVISPLLSLFINVSSGEFVQTAKDSEVIDSILMTLSVSAISTLIFSIAAIPLAFLLARSNFKLKPFVNAIIDLPVMIPHSAAGIALLSFLSKDTLMGKFGGSMGFSFVGTQIGIGMAMAFVSLPFLINAARDAFEKVPVQLEKASLNLGASTSQTFFKISLPLAKRGVISGLIMMFARGLSEFGAVIIIAYHPMVTPVMIYDRFTTYGLSYAQSVAAIFIIISLLVFAALRYFSNMKIYK